MQYKIIIKKLITAVKNIMEKIKIKTNSTNSGQKQITIKRRSDTPLQSPSQSSTQPVNNNKPPKHKHPTSSGINLGEISKPKTCPICRTSGRIIESDDGVHRWKCGKCGSLF
ncbi:MAG: hypothetical protein IJU48_05175 [Synergistaceae bacterium]|nr:hypothetical protein [Synergistaceae bacterium]